MKPRFEQRIALDSIQRRPDCADDQVRVVLENGTIDLRRLGAEGSTVALLTAGTAGRLAHALWEAASKRAREIHDAHNG